MVKQIEKNSQTIYVCEACGFGYKQREWAARCQEWCQKHQSCNLEISQHAIPLRPQGESDDSKRGGRP